MPLQVEVLASCTAGKDGMIEVSTSLLEEYFNVSRKTLSQWEKKGCPKLARGNWDLIAVLKWRGGLLSSCDGDESQENVNLKKIKADTFLKEQQGQIAEIELQKLRGEILSINDVEQLIGNIIVNTKGLLQALPSKAAPKLLGLSLLDDLKSTFYDRKDDFSKVKTHKELKSVIDDIVLDFYEAKSLVEINEVLTALVHESLEELSDLSIEKFERDIYEETDSSTADTSDKNVEAP